MGVALASWATLYAQCQAKQAGAVSSYEKARADLAEAAARAEQAKGGKP